MFLSTWGGSAPSEPIFNLALIYSDYNGFGGTTNLDSYQRSFPQIRYNQDLFNHLADIIERGLVSVDEVITLEPSEVQAIEKSLEIVSNGLRTPFYDIIDESKSVLQHNNYCNLYRNRVSLKPSGLYGLIKNERKKKGNPMESIEFETEVRENHIKLPDHFKNLNLKHVRVVIFEATSGHTHKRILPKGFYNPLHAPTYRMIGKREEIHER